MVSVASVDVVPQTVNAMEGERVQLVATVHDDHDEPLVAAVAWSSDDPRIASVDDHGLVEARAVGTAVVRARFQDVSGATEVRVLRGPFLAVSRGTVSLYAAPGAAPEPEVVAVTNGGGGALEDLSARVVAAQGESADWLRAELSGRTAPAQLTLTARSEALPSGMYHADVRIAAPGAPDAVVGVVASVAGFGVGETDGGTSVSEHGGTDQISVVLSARPAAPVVLNVTSSDPDEASVSPGSLRFMPTDWSTPRSVTVRGVDDDVDDGDRTVTVIVSVDIAQSHDAFEGLGDRTVDVVVTDDDEGAKPRLVIGETGHDTRVSESGTYDSISVSLSARPTSNVVLSVSSENIFEVQVTSPALITFSPSSWGVPQFIVVRGVDDPVRDGRQDVAVTVAVVSFLSADPYDGQSERVMVRNEDDDGGGRGHGDDDDGSGRGGRGG